MTEIIQHVAVSVGSELEPNFRANLRAKVTRATAGIRANVGVRADISAADRASFRASVRTRLTGLKVDVRLGLDLSGISRTGVRAAVKKALAGVDPTTIKVKLALDPASVAKLKAELKAISKAIVIDVSYRERARPDPLGGSGRGGGSGLLDAQTRLSVFLLQRFGTVVPTALAPAIAAAGALSASVVNAGAALGVFAGAAAGHFVQIKDAAEQAKEGLPIEKDFQGILTAIDRVKVSYTDLLDATREPVFKVFGDSINFASSILPRFVPLIDATAASLSTVVAQIYEFTQGGPFASFLQSLQTTGPRAIQSFTRSLIDITTGLLGVVQAFSGMEGDLLGGLGRMTARFATFGQTLGASSGFREFTNYVRESGPILLGTLGDLAGAFGTILAAAAPLGQPLLKVISAFAAIINAVPTPVLTGLIAVFTTVKLATLATTVAMGVFRLATIAATAATIAQSSRTAFAAVVMTALTGSTARAGAVMAAVAGFAARLGAATTFAGRAAIFGSAAFAGLRVALLGLLRATIVLGVISLAATALFGLIDKITQSKQKDVQATKEYISTGLSLAQVLRDQGQAAAIASARQAVLGDETGKAQNRLRQFAAIGGDVNDFYSAMSGNTEAATRSQAVFNTAIAETDRKLAELRANPPLGNAERLATQSQIATLEAQKKSLQANRDELQNTANAAATYAANVLLGAGATEKATDSLRQFILAGNDAFAQFQTRFEAQTSGYEKVSDAVISAHETWQDAIRSTVHAERGLRNTIEDTARAEHNAADQVVDAQSRVKDAYREVKEAQEALTRAREEAARQLRDQADTEESAQIRLLRAQIDAAAYTGQPVDRAAIEADIAKREALLELKNAQEDLNDTQIEGARLRGQGIEGNPNVTNAKDAATRAENAHRDAIKEVKEAQDNYNRTLRDGREARDDARVSVEQATQSEQRAKTAYDDTTIAAGYQIDTAKTLKSTLDNLVGVYTEELKLAGGPETAAGIETVRINIEAMRLAAEHPDWTAAQAWTEATNTVRSTGTMGRPSPNSYNANVAKNTDRPRPTGTTRVAFASGGRVFGPGTETSDSIPALLSVDEHVLTAKEVRAMGGHDRVEEIRRAALEGGSAFAGGGRVLGPTADITKFNPAQTLINKGIIDKARAAIQNFFVGEIGDPQDVGPVGGANVKGKDTGVWRALRAILEARFPNMKDRDFGGFQNRLTATGNVSYHAYGKALDIMKHSMEVFNFIKGKYGAQAHELIYSPAGNEQVYKGKPHNYSGVTKAMHYNHIHFSMDDAPGGGDGASLLAPGGASTVGLRPDQLQAAFLANSPGAGAPTVGGDLGAWMSQAIGYAGVPASWIGGPGKPGLYTLIMRESGGNPKSINNWDSNAKKGDPSRGLMQTIGGTFNAYRDKRLSNDIYDPVSNIVAGLNYIKSRYKSIFNVQQADPNKSPKGYREGGPVDVGLFDNGGTLEHGKAALNLSGRPETVRSGAQEDRLEQLLSNLVDITSNEVRLDAFTIGRLAQVIYQRPAELTVDKRVVAETAFSGLDLG